MAKPNKLQDVLDITMDNVVPVKDLLHESMSAAQLNKKQKKKKKKAKKTYK